MTGSGGFSHRIRVFLGTLMANYAKIVYRTSRFSNDPKNLTEHLAENSPVIIAVWHGQHMLFPLMWPHQKPIEILISRHKSAEFGAIAFEKLGAKVIRGSGSGQSKTKPEKGGARSLRQMLRALNRGSSIASVVDIPVGPSRRAGRGIIKLSQLSGIPIVPLAVTTRFRILLNSWSRFAFNLPCSRGSIVLGEAITVARDADEETLERKRLQLENCLNALTVKADTLVGRKPHYDAGGPVPGLNSSYYLYFLATHLLSSGAPFWLRSRLERGKEQQGRTREKLGHTSHPRPRGTVIWIHATSIGEATSCLGLIEKLLLRDDLNILVTTTTVTAAEVLKSRLPERAFHQYAPLDLPGAVHRFLDYWHPDIAVFAESEIWPNTIVQLHKRKIPIALVNGRLSKRSYRRWRKVSGLIRLLLARFAHISAQSHENEQRLASLGAYNTMCFGNMKADVPGVPVPQHHLRELKKQIGQRRLWLAASTHSGEEELILDCHKILCSRFPDLLTIIVPRHRERADEISKLIDAQDLSATLRSSGHAISKNTDIYLADTLGELPLFYELSAVGFIGGSLVDVGGHNPIEAINGGSVVLHGVHVNNFKDIYQLLDRHKGAIKITSSTELAKEVEQLLNSKQKAAAITAPARAQAETLKGATEKTAKALLALLNK